MSPAPERATGLDAFIVSGEAGSIIYKAGDLSAELFVIQRGQVELLDRSTGRRAALLELGEFFGEQALFTGAPRDHTARALTSYALVKLDWAALQAVVRHNPNIALAMLRALHRGHTQHEEPVARHARQDAPAARTELPGPGPSSKAEPDIALFHPVSGTRYRLMPQRAVIVGRRDKTTGVAPDVDLTDLDASRTLSRRHLQITWRGDDCFATEPVKTPNGSFVNGRRLDPGAPVRLQHGDHLQLGIVELVFEGGQ